MTFIRFVTRRDLLKWAGATGAAVTLPVLPLGCKSSGTTSSAFFSPAEKNAIGALADAVIPPDDTPGGALLGAADYIEQLLTAFDVTPPMIFAGGPYSGRQPFVDGNGAPSTNFPPDDFLTFLPLDRVTERAWRLRIYGSSGVDGGGPNDAVLGPIQGLRDQVKSLLATAMGLSTTPLETLDPSTLKSIFLSIDPALRGVFIDLVLESSFGAPEYGGNKAAAGWALCNYEGDSQPLGYSLFDVATGTYKERPDAPMSTANPGPDPAPMDAATKSLILTVVGVTGGKSF